MVELRVGGKFRFTKKLGNGAFGDIFSGVNIKTGEEVAIKLVISIIKTKDCLIGAIKIRNSSITI